MALSGMETSNIHSQICPEQKNIWNTKPKLSLKKACGTRSSGTKASRWSLVASHHILGFANDQRLLDYFSDLSKLHLPRLQSINVSFFHDHFPRLAGSQRFGVH